MALKGIKHTDMKRISDMAEKQIAHLISKIEEKSIAARLGICPGDSLISVNGESIEDVFDYRYRIMTTKLNVEIRKKDGTEVTYDIKKNEFDDLGIEFENSFMSEYRSCSNKCIFCFIDQMPPGMRPTLYFKDDDSRLSFLQGNYITLTNMREKDIERIIKYHLAPINVSVHTTNPELRVKMLHNRFAGNALSIIDRFYEAGIEMNAQVVLCPDINDGDELRRTISDLSKYVPVMPSLSIVPCGLTKYRDGLFPLRPVTKEDACAVIDIVEEFQKKIFKEKGLHFVQASDEFYITAGRKIPEEERYDGYLQLENGVGMIRLMENEFKEALRSTLRAYVKRHPLSLKKQKNANGKTTYTVDMPKREYSFATGKLAAPYIRKYAEWFMRYVPSAKFHVYEIRNDFFGEMITVAGLVTGGDLMKQLKGRELGSRLVLPSVMFRSGEEVFLDDVTKSEAEKTLQVPIHIVKSGGQDLVDVFMGRGIEDTNHFFHNPYELDRLNAKETEDE